MPWRHAYQLTKYDPADRDEDGRYVGPHDERSDRGPLEAAYLDVVSAFAAEVGISELDIREPQVASDLVNFGLDEPTQGHGLVELFGDQLHGYHDGATVPLHTALEVVRAMLRDAGAWCRLERNDQFGIHVGYDQYVYISTDRPCPEVGALAAERGLFVEAISESPYSWDPDDAKPARGPMRIFGTNWPPSPLRVAVYSLRSAGPATPHVGIGSLLLPRGSSCAQT